MSEGNPVIKSADASTEAKLAVLVTLAQAQKQQTGDLAEAIKEHRTEFTVWKDSDFRDVRDRVMGLESDGKQLAARHLQVIASITACDAKHSGHASKADVENLAKLVRAEGRPQRSTLLKHVTAWIAALAVAVPAGIAAWKSAATPPSTVSASSAAGSGSGHGP